MTHSRLEDSSDQIFFSSKRFFSVNSCWFFSTREKHNIGPFSSLEEAELELSLQLKNSGVLHHELECPLIDLSEE